jgi:thymidine kinase
MELTSLPSINLIIGPMFSGKSTELLRRLTIYAEMGFEVLYINSALDTRSEKEFSTHNPLIGTIHPKITKLKTNDIMKVAIDDFFIIGIDEGQLISNLKQFVVNAVEEKGKIVIVAGLNGDFKREKFGEINDLLPLCDTIEKLNPFCKLCMDSAKIITHAIFTKRIVANTEVVVIGDHTSYIPVCRECYLHS